MTAIMTEGQDIVLLVDDDLAVRDSLKFALELEGLSVCAYGSGRELFGNPDLSKAGCLLLDYKMPAMDGFEVLAELAAQKVDLPVIFITSQVNHALARRAREAGVRHIVEKPLLDGALLDTIRGVLAEAPKGHSGISLT